MKFVLPTLLTMAVLAVAGCESPATPTPNGTTPPDTIQSGPVVTSIRVTPDSVDLTVGDTLTLTAEAFDAAGSVMAGVSFTWTSSDDRVAGVVNGFVTGGGDGTASITAAAAGRSGGVQVYVSRPPEPLRSTGIWISPLELSALPSRGPAWGQLKAEANRGCGRPDLSDQDDDTNVCVLAKALVYVRLGGMAYQTDVLDALRRIADSGRYRGRTLALGRELAAYVIAA